MHSCGPSPLQVRLVTRMKHSNPCVSVIVTTRNSAHVLGACLGSVQKQSYPNIELIVVDNNSTDTTKMVAKEYTDEVFTHGPERSAQRNYGVKRSTGSYVLIIDSDMEVGAEVVAACVDVLASKPAVKGVVIPEKSFGEGFWGRCKQFERSFYVGVDWLEAARFFDRAVYQLLGGYDETLVGPEDWDLSQRLSERYELGRIAEFIRHNEGRLSPFTSLRKKFYYGAWIAKYAAKPGNRGHAAKQLSVGRRYGLFLQEPRRLAEHPLLSGGVALLKSAEFCAGGAGYALGFLRPSRSNLQE